jgi:CAI-1 autoinducer synthase
MTAFPKVRNFPAARPLPPFITHRLAEFESETVRADRSAHAIVLGPSPTPLDLDLRSNDYLAIGRHPDVLRAQIRELEHSGNHQMMSAVFLTSGNPQAELERRFAAFCRAEATIMFQSGYQANTGLIQTIARASTPVYLDRMAHASLYQGVLAAGAELRTFRHNDVAHLNRQVMASGPGVIAIDSVYSTDGSLAPIEAVLRVAENMGCALVVDESHSLGTHGPCGVIIMRKPPALPGDSKSLTFPAFDGRDGAMLGYKSEGADKERQPRFSISSAGRLFVNSFSQPVLTDRD